MRVEVLLGLADVLADHRRRGRSGRGRARARAAITSAAIVLPVPGGPANSAVQPLADARACAPKPHSLVDDVPRCRTLVADLAQLLRARRRRQDEVVPAVPDLHVCARSLSPAPECCRQAANRSSRATGAPAPPTPCPSSHHNHPNRADRIGSQVPNSTSADSQGTPRQAWALPAAGDAADGAAIAALGRIEAVSRRMTGSATTYCRRLAASWRPATRVELIRGSTPVRCGAAAHHP